MVNGFVGEQCTKVIAGQRGPRKVQGRLCRLAGPAMPLYGSKSRDKEEYSGIGLFAGTAGKGSPCRHCRVGSVRVF